MLTNSAAIPFYGSSDVNNILDGSIFADQPFTEQSYTVQPFENTDYDYYYDDSVEFVVYKNGDDFFVTHSKASRATRFVRNKMIQLPKTLKTNSQSNVAWLPPGTIALNLHKIPNSLAKKISLYP